MLWEYDSFDKYADETPGADALPLMTSPSAHRCNCARLRLDETVLQFGSGANGTIVHGKTCRNSFFLFMQSLERARALVFDGRIIKWPEIVVIAPAADFTFACTGMAQWISLSVAIEPGNGGGNLRNYFDPTQNNKTLITPPAAELRRFIDAATAAREAMQLAEPRRKIDAQAIEASLLEILPSILANSVVDGRGFDQRSEEIIAKVRERLRRNHQVSVAALAEAAGVSERTLHRAFRKYFHMGPKRYLKMRQLNLVRRAIRQNGSAPASVTDILTQHGVTEFGRFAIEYKALFRESPAETLQKRRALRSRGSQLRPGL